MYYGRRWRAWTAALALGAILIVVAVLQIVFVLVLRGPYARGISWPVMMFGIIACLVLISGYLPLPLELMKRRGRCIGVDFWFLLLDSSGAFFSLMSLGQSRLVCDDGMD
jgi:ABC-type Fe3+-siderophore transport system permease subunit